MPYFVPGCAVRALAEVGLDEFDLGDRERLRGVGVQGLGDPTGAQVSPVLINSGRRG